MIVQFDCEWDTDNQIRMLQRTLRGAVTLRALREALWRIGLEHTQDEILVRARACERVMGRPRIEPQFTTSGTVPANAQIKPVDWGGAYRKAVADNSERAKIRRGKK